MSSPSLYPISIHKNITFLVFSVFTKKSKLLTSVGTFLLCSQYILLNLSTKNILKHNLFYFNQENHIFVFVWDIFMIIMA